MVEVSPEELAAHREPFTRDFQPQGTREWPDVEASLAALTGADVLVLGVHGGDGENGRLQRTLEERGIAFTGSGSRASELAFNKSRALAIAFEQGVRTARGLSLAPRAPGEAREMVSNAFDELGPMVLKPDSGGSSILLSFVRTTEDLDAASAMLAQHPEVEMRAEELIVGREFTIGVVEDAAGERALPCSEVIMQHGRNFDYEGKYFGAGSIEITPAEVSSELGVALQHVALTMHRRLGCRGYSRTDVLVDDRGPVYLETNTLPGLSARSFIPQQLEAAGIPFKQFLREQLAIAVERQRSP